MSLFREIITIQCIKEIRRLTSLTGRQINFLPPARHLHLPCITFSVKRLIVQARGSGGEKVYRAWVGPKTVEFTTADPLPLRKPQRLVFAHPWTSHIRGPNDEDV